MGSSVCPVPSMCSIQQDGFQGGLKIKTPEEVVKVQHTPSCTCLLSMPSGNTIYHVCVQVL